MVQMTQAYIGPRVLRTKCIVINFIGCLSGPQMS
jgi:hypothetical protein